MIDVHNTWVTLLPNVLSLNVVCFFTGFLLMCFGICLANNCLLPIVPTDIFPRDLSELLHKKYNQIKTTFDLTCLTTTVILSLVILHHLYGIGIGTFFCAECREGADAYVYHTENLGDEPYLWFKNSLEIM